MNGLLIVNHFLNSAKFEEIYQWLCISANKKGIKLKRCSNADVIVELNRNPMWLLEPESRPDFVLFWDKDIRLAKLIESYGVRLFNSSDSIEICNDKARMYITLRNHSVEMPKTSLIPMSFHHVDWEKMDLLHEICESFSFPIILKECYGSFGERVFLVHSIDELIKKIMGIENRPVIIQEFISSSKGRDIRVNVVGDNVIASMFRYSVTSDFRANVTNGGKMKVWEPTSEQAEMAVSACKILGLDFGGVDILFDENDAPILCEVNSNAHFKNIFDCTGINVADYTLDYIKKCIYE